MKELLNQDLAAINFGCLKWHMRLNPKKAKSMLFSRFGTIARGYSDITLGGAELEVIRVWVYLGYPYTLS